MRRLKILVIGDAGVGKTAMLRQLQKPGIYSEEYQATIGVDLVVKTIDDIRMGIWDVAGSLPFRSIIRSYFSGVHVVLILVDLTQRSSLHSMHDWLQETEFHAPRGVRIVIVGNKLDAQCDRQVYLDELKLFGHHVFEISARTGENIPKLFEYIIREAGVQGDELPDWPSTIDLTEQPRKEKCCTFL